MGLIKIDDNKGIVAANNKPITENEIDSAVKDVFTNRTSIVASRYDSVIRSLSEFVEGAPIIVEYYQKHIPYDNKQSANTSFSFERANAHTSYTLIHNFEFKLDGELDISQDQDTLEMIVNGKGIIYPGFIPHLGDLFFLKLENDEIGLFTITNVERLTIKQGSYRNVSFTMLRFLDQETNNKITSSVVEELYFDKEKFLTDTATILSTDSYNQLNKLKDMRNRIIDQYVSEFYSIKDKTFIINRNFTILDVDNNPVDKPVKLFDPYLVDYMCRKISLSSLPYPVERISNSITVFSKDNVFWDMLFDQNVNNLNYIYFNPAIYRFSIWDNEISGLVNKVFVYLYNDINEFDNDAIVPMYETVDKIMKAPYVFSYRFYIALIYLFRYDSDLASYAVEKEELEQTDLDLLMVSGNTSDIEADNTYLKDVFVLTDFEIFVLNYIGKKYLIPIDSFITNYIDVYPYNTLTKEERFYRLPILLYFIDLYISSIT